GANGAAVSFAAKATDAVDGSDTVVFSEGLNEVHSGDIFGLGQHTITETATDAAGNASTSSFTITVQDTTARSVTRQSDLTVEATGANGAAVSFAATASDVVDGTDTVVFSEGLNQVNSGDTFGLGQHTISEAATDAAGNTSTTSFTITVQDTTA